MDTTPIQSIGASNPTSPTSNPFLVSLQNKVASGDWIGECMYLFACSRSDEYRLQKQGVKRQHQLIHEAREMHKKLLQKQRRAKKKSGFLKVLGAVTGAVVGAISIVVAAYCPLAAGGIALVGAFWTGSMGVSAAIKDQSAMKAGGNAMLAQQQSQDASEARAEILSVMEQSVLIEQRMGERLAELAESECGIRDAALSGMRR